MLITYAGNDIQTAQCEGIECSRYASIDRMTPCCNLDDGRGMLANPWDQRKGVWSYVDAVVNLQGVWRSIITTTTTPTTSVGLNQRKR